MPQQSFPYTSFSLASGDPVSMGYVLIRLSEDGQTPVGSICRDLPLRVNLDGNGTMTTVPTVWLNQSILPSGTVYLADVYTSEGERVSSLQITAEQETFSVTVPGDTTPWRWVNGGINTNYQFGDGSGSNPAVAPTGTLQPGQALSITATGVVDSKGAAPSGPAGSPPPTGDDIVSGLCFPTFYMPGSQLGIGGLCAAFTDSSGNVIQPLSVGSSATFNVPSGATQVQFGVSDNVLGDNTGSFTVTVTLI